MSEIIDCMHFTDERSLFKGRDLSIKGSSFDEGESPLKHTENVRIEDSTFRWKYPLWYSKNIHVVNSTFDATARAGIWYTENVRVENSKIYAPKIFRRASGIELKNVSFTDAEETLWECKDIKAEGSDFKGNYLFMNSSDLYLKDVKIDGNYSFDGCRNIRVESSVINSKDAFWNTENVYVKDSVVNGEYIGWNSKNLTFENCKISSIQGFCYIDRLVIRGGDLSGVTLAFEYSSVDVDSKSRIESILNPKEGKIALSGVNVLILQDEFVDSSETAIDIPDIAKRDNDPKKYL